MVSVSISILLNMYMYIYFCLVFLYLYLSLSLPSRPHSSILSITTLSLCLSFSQAYAGARFTGRLLQAMGGAKDIVECAFVENTLTAAPFFSTPVRTCHSCSIVFYSTTLWLWRLWGLWTPPAPPPPYTLKLVPGIDLMRPDLLMLNHWGL